MLDITKPLKPKALAVIRVQCVLQALEFEECFHEGQSLDAALIKGGGAKVLFNRYRGTCWITIPDGRWYGTETVDDWIDEPWAIELLNFFYEN